MEPFVLKGPILLRHRKASGGRMLEINLDLFSVQSKMYSFYCNKLISNNYVFFHT